jgi:hypothetical protein
VPFVEYE